MAGGYFFAGSFQSFPLYDFFLASQDFIGANEDSWNFLAKVVNDVFAGSEREFGYFVYSPDKFAYEPKYAMVYGVKQNPDKNVYYFEKKSVTYVITAPSPPDNPFMQADWWIVSSIKINKKPQKVIKYPDGHKVERYELTPEEMAIPFDKHEDTGIHFR